MGRAATSAPMFMVEDELQKRLFGLNMKRARELAGNMSQETLADLLGVDRRMVNRWENSGREPRPPRRREIAQKLGQPLPFFYDECVLRDAD